MKIILSITMALFLVACSDDAAKQTQKAHEQKVQKNTTKEVKPVKKEVIAKKTIPKNIEKVDIEPKKTIEKNKTTESNIQKKENIQKKANNESIEVEKIVQEIVTIEESKVINPKTVYKACSSCHGENAQKAALGKSKIIKGWSSDKIINALNGYKDGTYGGSMKALMAGQAKMLSDEKTKIVAEYISKL
jgi:cytochrome c553